MDKSLFTLINQGDKWQVMLYEIPHLRQSKRSYVKRWFTSRDMDLFIWLRNSEPVRFQLTYDKRSEEKAISWNFQLGFNHYLVDTGETRLDHYKQTPILINLCEQQNLASIARDFLAASENIGIGLSDFIYARLMAQPTIPVKYSATRIDPSRSR